MYLELRFIHINLKMHTYFQILNRNSRNYQKKACQFKIKTFEVFRFCRISMKHVYNDGFKQVSKDLSTFQNCTQLGKAAKIYKQQKQFFKSTIIQKITKKQKMYL